MKRKRKKLNHRYIQAVLEEIRNWVIFIIGLNTIADYIYEKNMLNESKKIQNYNDEIKACFPEYFAENLCANNDKRFQKIEEKVFN